MPLANQVKYRNLVLIGCGPHYRKRYHSVLEAENTTISLLIDLQDQEETILNFFQDKKLKPDKTLFLDERFRNSLSPDLLDYLVPKTDLVRVDAVILCTEPKVRKPYALWALNHKLPLFMDKPPCAFPSLEQKDTLLFDYEEIVHAAEKAEVSVVVSCERRGHFGYLWLMDYLLQFIQEEEVPITSINIHFANGNWVTPLEYLHQEQHPFKYGYGLLLHSGYHYVDLLSSFISLNQSDAIDYYLKTLSTTPQDLLSGVNSKNMCRLSTSSTFQQDLSAFGETSIFLIGQAKIRERLLTSFSMQLENTSVSKRTCDTPSQEAKWRMRQEHVLIHLGHLASIHISCIPFKKLDPNSYPIEDFNIVIMHSPLLTNRQPMITMTREAIPILPHNLQNTGSLNQYAREWQLREFLNGRNGNSLLTSHRNTVQLLDLIYSEIHSQQTPISTEQAPLNNPRLT